MSRKILLIAMLLAALWAQAGVSLAKKGTATQLMVDGKPYIIAGGELGNSSATCADDIARIFPKLRDMNLNTVLVPVYWDLTEPEEGKFDFSLTHTIIDTARENGLKVIFLWFGAWKNSMSCYAPAWFKADYKRFPRAQTHSGKPLEIACAFSKNVYDADSRAFSAWLRHVKDYDPQGTVLMVQIENEIGMLEDARDHSPAAEAAYNKGVPEALTKFLKKNKEILHPSLRQRWEDNGCKMTGSWESVFGPGIYTDEIFMAWNYARYVEGLAREAKAILGRPVYVNAAMNSRGRKPGEYPSAGPLAHLKDIWHAAAPTVDLLAPDLYDKGFTGWVAQYSMPDNPLFIPEIRQSRANPVQALYVAGEHDAIGLSPFSIENASPADITAGYAKIREVMPLLTAHQGTGAMKGLYFDADSTGRVIRDGKLKITARHYFTLPWDPRASDGSEWPVAGGVIIRTAPDEYIICGSGIVVTFENLAETATAQRLGEDGFLESGADRKDAGRWNGGRRIGIASCEEVGVLPDGSLERTRSYGGDETHQGRHVRIGVDNYQTLHVKLYEYE